jgi:hypothetical protein
MKRCCLSPKFLHKAVEIVSRQMIVSFPLVVAATTLSFAQLREYPDASLIGIQGVRVVVDYQAPNEGMYGLTQKNLQDAVKERLTVDNVKVLDEKQWEREPGSPYLYVHVVGTPVETGGKRRLFVFSFSADLIQRVSLHRKPSYITDGATWSQGYFVVVPQDELRKVTLQISDVAHDFAESVHQANAGSHGKVQ